MADFTEEVVLAQGLKGQTNEEEEKDISGQGTAQAVYKGRYP